MMKIADVMDKDLINPHFLTTLTNLTKDKQWRVRQAAITLIGNLSCKFGRDMYAKSFSAIFTPYLTNSAAIVRDEGII